MNPYESLAAQHEAYMQQNEAFRRARRTQVPTLAMVEAAFLADDLDVEQFEWLVGAALEGRAVELPRSMEKLLDMRALPYTDAPGGVDAYVPSTWAYGNREERLAFIRARLNADL